VDKAALMHPTEGRYDGNSKGQELPNLHRFAKVPVKRVATRLLEDEYRPIAIEFKRPSGPPALQMVLQSVLMRKTIETGLPRTFCGQP
jgi:hypothetical protein